MTQSPAAHPLLVCFCAIAMATLSPAWSNRQEEPRFRGGIELINVTATVTDEEGRFDLLDKEDELFFVEFGYSARLTQGWTVDRRLIRHALEDVSAPTGDTALYDAIALALPTAQEGRHVKKALLVISDGNDTRSVVSARELRQSIVESDVLVYALGLDDAARTTRGRESRPDVDALRRITDETGGRTEVVRGVAGLDAAISRIAAEFGQQYSLGYTSTAAKDGRWHSIRVEVRSRRVNVRARRGFIPS